MAGETVRRPYVRHRPALWWTRNPRYLLFQVRELSSVFVAAYALLFLYQLWSLRGGPGSYAAFLNFWYSPLVILVTVAILGFVLLHAVTWFLLIPKALPGRIVRTPASRTVIFVLMVAVWLAVSYLVAVVLFTPAVPIVPAGGH